ncbi:(2Fe-2S)-binding protein [Yoonia sp. SS1-5]|uniref:(2Fe-2S)-binding protein n=1 Tax=Yoonia rhodophyticola TaxID=3137370 RepID=A0ABZ3JC23_9RHOB
MPKTPVTFTLNGAETGIFVDPGQNLLEALRREAGDLSPKFGCGQGTCGACTVLIDGAPHLSCLVLAQAAEGAAISTNGGLAPGADLHPLQAAFAEGFAAQCGFCTGGMLMAAKALLDHNPRPSREEVIEAISGNLCRCTGYDPIIDAILDAANRIQGRAIA